jgi:hypothetical protein
MSAARSDGLFSAVEENAPRESSALVAFSPSSHGSLFPVFSGLVSLPVVPVSSAEVPYA